MDISVEELSPVNKEVTISATSEDIEPKIESAIKKYRGQINLPGFRPGKVPTSLIRKRFGKEIEQEEVNKYIQEVFEKEVVPEHNPVGESQMTNFEYEDGKLEATFKIGAKPEFELVDLSDIEVDKMVHDVTDEEVEEELESIQKNAGNWVEQDGPIEESHRVTVDAQALDSDGNPIEGDLEEDQKLELSNEGNAEFREALVGKKVGDEVTVALGDDEEQEQFHLTVKNVEALEKPDLDEEFVNRQSNGEAENLDEFKSFLKSRIQQYYDQVSDDLFKNEVIDQLVSAHDFEVPDTLKEQILNIYINQVRQQQGGDLPEDFDRESFKEARSDQAEKDAKWQFINEKLQEQFDDIEIQPEDVDAYLGNEAARYGVSLDQMKQIYAQNADQLERLRSSIREDKVFEKLSDEVAINEISKEAYQEKNEQKEI